MRKGDQREAHEAHRKSDVQRGAKQTEEIWAPIWSSLPLRRKQKRRAGWTMAHRSGI